MAALAPGYVGGWTALHHWDLTDQVRIQERSDADARGGDRCR
jgi:hypothetical protein